MTEKNTIKCVVVGDAAVGKTSFDRFLHKWLIPK